MKGIGAFSPDGKHKWMVFLLVVLVQLGVLSYIGWRWHNISVDGIPYQWRCLPRLEESSFGTDYVRVVFPEDTTTWMDESAPEEGEKIYVHISHDASGLMKVEGASAEKPGIGGDYMDAVVVSFQDGVVQFKVAFDRYRIAPELADGIYNISEKDNVVASVRMKKGQGVIEGVFVNGIPLEECGNGAAMAEARAKKEDEQKQKTASVFNKPSIVESGMVPPTEE